MYFKLSEFKGGMEVQREKVVEALKDRNCGYFYETSATNFSKIPGSPIAYWVNNAVLSVFTRGQSLGNIANPCQGLISGDVNRFVRKWFECSLHKLCFNGKNGDVERNGKWFPYSNGGAFLRWYGNNEDVVNWENDGFEIRNFFDENGKLRSRPQGQRFYFQEGGTWSAISSGAFSVRYYPDGYLFSNAGMAVFSEHETLLYLIAFLNSKLCSLYLKVFNEGLNFNQGDIVKLPIIFSKDNIAAISITNHNIEISKDAWDSYETSWDFKRHPLV